jgi:2-polyprenyl-6-methoxyphenol hydroxylase-like FAD-dependent oxidoreductase
MATQPTVSVVFLDTIGVGLTKQRITLMGDAAHLMTPFAGVGVNVAMEDALELCGALTEAGDKKSIARAVRGYEVKMWKRAHEAAELNMMYQGLFFHERGGIAMVKHFEEQKLSEGKA